MSEEQKPYIIDKLESYKIQLKYVLKPHQKLLCIFDWETSFEYFEKGDLVEYIGRCCFSDGKIKVFFKNLKTKKVHELLIDNIVTEFKEYFVLLLNEGEML